MLRKERQYIHTSTCQDLITLTFCIIQDNEIQNQSLSQLCIILDLLPEDLSEEPNEPSSETQLQFSYKEKQDDCVHTGRNITVFWSQTQAAAAPSLQTTGWSSSQEEDFFSLLPVFSPLSSQNIEKYTLTYGKIRNLTQTDMEMVR